MLNFDVILVDADHLDHNSFLIEAKMFAQCHIFNLLIDFWDDLIINPSDHFPMQINFLLLLIIQKVLKTIFDVRVYGII